MAKYTTQDIRNIVLVGHGGTGKTTLAEAMLFRTGTINKMGSIDEHNTVSDYAPDEKERKISIDASALHCDFKGKRINVIDAPGYPDFTGAALQGMAAVETAFIVLNANAGLELNARKMWEQAGKRGLGRVIVINRLDGDNIDFDSLMGEIHEAFGKNCIPYNLPTGVGGNFKGVENVLTPSASPKAVVGGTIEDAHQQLIETIVEADEKLMEKYLEEGKVSDAEVAGVFARAIAQGQVAPVLCTMAENCIGVEELLNFVAQFCPSPVEGRRRMNAGAEGAETAIDPLGPKFCAQVFKVNIDPFVGKLSFFRVLSGSVKTDTVAYNPRIEKNERTGRLLSAQGKETQPVAEVINGDIGAIAKVETILMNDTLCQDDAVLRVKPIEFVKPMVTLAVEPKSRKDEQKISASLQKLADEDPTFQVERDRQTKELVIRGLSQFHLDIMIARLQHRFEVDVTTKQPKIAYLETITAKGDGHYRHKKQTGGRGQFGECYVRVMPLERGKGFEFENKVFGGAVPSNFMPAIEKGAREELERGILAGHPVVDVRVEAYDGSYHDVDSDEQSFKIAGARAFRDGFMNAKPVLLEPIVNIEITIPSRFMGDIAGDLSGRRGRIVGMDSVGNLQVIKAQVPMKEIGKYSTELRSMTGGEASYSVEFSHYDIVPHKLAEEIIAQAKKTPEEE
jgi:elongation factor G